MKDCFTLNFDGFEIEIDDEFKKGFISVFISKEAKNRYYENKWFRVDIPKDGGELVIKELTKEEQRRVQAKG